MDETLLCDEISFSDLMDNLRHVFRVTSENLSLDAPSSDDEHWVYTTNKSLKLSKCNNILCDKVSFSLW